MTLKQRLLADEAGTWLAEWVLLAVMLATLCIMGVTAARQGALASVQDPAEIAQG